MGEELGVDGKMSKQHDSDVFLVDLEELEKLRDHMFPVEGHRQQAFFTATITTSGCTQERAESTRSTAIKDSQSRDTVCNVTYRGF